MRTREAQIDAAIDAFYRGFVADRIGDFLSQQDALIEPDDLAAWSPTYESPIVHDYRGWTVCKAPTWSQGPVLLQALALLEGFELTGRDNTHLMVEAMKLALADREAWYGDPAFFDVPMRDLLAEGYNAERRSLIGDEASGQLRPGSPGGRVPVVPRYDTGGRGSEPLAAANAAGPERPAAERGFGRGPSPAHEGDTCHLDVIDRWGNVVAATPSGGWLTSSPVIPGLGFPLGTRGQMFWLQEGLASSLRPGARPRTTLTPSIAIGPRGQRMAFGTPGGDSQDQWCLQFFVNVVDHGMDLQAAIDAPYFQTNHAPDSFFPVEPNRCGCSPKIAFRRRQWPISNVAVIASSPPARGHWDAIVRHCATPMVSACARRRRHVINRHTRSVGDLRETRRRWGSCRGYESSTCRNTVPARARRESSPTTARR